MWGVYVSLRMVFYNFSVLRDLTDVACAYVLLYHPSKRVITEFEAAQFQMLADFCDCFHLLKNENRGEYQKPRAAQPILNSPVLVRYRKNVNHAILFSVQDCDREAIHSNSSQVRLILDWISKWSLTHASSSSRNPPTMPHQDPPASTRKKRLSQSILILPRDKKSNSSQPLLSLRSHLISRNGVNSARLEFPRRCFASRNPSISISAPDNAARLKDGLKASLAQSSSERRSAFSSVCAKLMMILPLSLHE